MANRYANLVGSNKIKDEWQKINAGFDAVQADMDTKADSDDLASLESTVTNHIGAGGSAHAEATDQQAGFMSAADKTKLDGIEPGAQVNQNAFAKVNDVVADDPSDTVTITGGTGITITTNPNTKEVTITATGESTPGPHGSSHTEHGADPIPAATTSEGGLMSAADKQMLESHAARHAVGGPDEITPGMIGAETPEGAQEKADQAEANAKQYSAQQLDAHKAEIATPTELGHVYGFRGALVRSTVIQSIPNDELTTLVFNDVIRDTDNFYSSGNPSRFTIPAGITKVKLRAHVRFGTNSEGIRWIQFIKNGEEGNAGSRLGVENKNAVEDGHTALWLESTVEEVIAGDYFEVAVRQTSGGSLNTISFTAHFEIREVK